MAFRCSVTFCGVVWKSSAICACVSQIVYFQTGIGCACARLPSGRAGIRRRVLGLARSCGNHFIPFPHTRSRTRWILASKRGICERTASICAASAPWPLAKAGMNSRRWRSDAAKRGKGISLGPSREGQRPVAIPAWGNAPGRRPNKVIRAESPCHGSIPHISLVVWHTIFLQEHPKLVLKRPRSVMFLLVVNVSAERIQISRADREAAIAALP